MTPALLAPHTPRAACTCLPSTRRQPRPCAACQAWDHGSVLLTDGTLVPRTHWVQAHTPTEEEAV